MQTDSVKCKRKVEDNMIQTPPPGLLKARGDTLQQEVANKQDPNVRRSARSNEGVAPARYDNLLQDQASKNRPAISQSAENSFSGAISQRSAGTPSVISQNSNSSRTRASRQLEIELRRQEELAELESQQADREREIIDLRARREEAKLTEEAEYNGQPKASNASKRSVITMNSNHSKVVVWLQRRNATDDRAKSRDCAEEEIDLTERDC